MGIFFSCSATFYSGFLRALFRPSHISYLSTFFTLFLLHFFNAIVLLSYVPDTFVKPYLPLLIEKGVVEITIGESLGIVMVAGAGLG